MITLIDNYDSFTYNLVHFLGELGADVKVYRNNVVTVDELLVVMQLVVLLVVQSMVLLLLLVMLLMVSTGIAVQRP